MMPTHFKCMTPTEMDGMEPCGVYDIISGEQLEITTMEDGQTASFEFYIGDYSQLAGC